MQYRLSDPDVDRILEGSPERLNTYTAKEALNKPTAL
jgi:hypothetical protein